MQRDGATVVNTVSSSCTRLFAVLTSE